SCTDNLIYTRCESQSERTVPGDLPDRLTDNRSRLQAPIYRRRTAEVSKAGRRPRNTLLKSASVRRLIRVNRIAANSSGSFLSLLMFLNAFALAK
ncbi:MAG: hypothetical protein LBK65_06980, partial [Tannerellaceae bacterium]|nr:hypothetical protein [Tannerellaceae bacterium]